MRQIENNPKTRSIIRFMIDMAHEMGIRLVAEGAETPAQVEFLRENGVTIFGYYSYKPMPENEFVTALDEKVSRYFAEICNGHLRTDIVI